MKSQSQRLREYMQAGHMVSSMMAFKRFGIVSLQRRLSDLRDDGMEIGKTWSASRKGKKPYRVYWEMK